MSKTKHPSKWDLSPLFQSDSDPKIETDKKRVQEESYKFINKWKEREDYLSDPKVLREALDEYEVWARVVSTDGNVGYYFWLREAQDESSTELKAKVNQIQDFSTKIHNDIQFFEIRIAKISEEMQSKFLVADELLKYKHFLENLFKEAKYLLSEPEEKLINLYSPMAVGNWKKMLNTFLSKSTRKALGEDEKQTEKTFEELMGLMNNKNKKVRDTAAKAVNEIFAEHLEVAESELNAVLQYKKVNDELRGISRPDLTRHISDDIDSEVVDALVEAVSSQFGLAQRYYALKAKLMGVKKLEYHERNVEYGSIDSKIEFDQAVEIVGRSLKKLDPQFEDFFQGFLNGYIDVYPEKGKSGGAFCAHNQLSQPTYILLNYTDTVRDVTTLAHEVGHGINNEMIRETQNALTAGVPMSTAEVASTFMEDFALEELVGEIDDGTQLSLNMGKLNDEVSTIFRQIACYKLEQDLHMAFRNEGYLSKEKIGEIFLKNMEAYMGDAIEQSEGSQNWWIYWSHIRSYFYVYSYSSGLLISKALQTSVRKDLKFISKVKEFLSAGRSASPKDIFANLGIDITDKTFWEKGIQRFADLLDRTEELASKLGKI